MKESKLIEFANIMDINKFYSKSNLLFSDKKPVFDFWKHNKDRILSSDDDYSKIIQKQYLLYSNKHLIEFSKERNLDKFNGSKDDLRFSDGTGMAKWFFSRNTKDEILSSNDEYSIRIQKDYEKYKNRRIIEFLNIDDLNKFYSKSNITFKDGSNVYRWWVINKKTIMSASDEYSVTVQKQYKKYETRKFLDKFYEFLLMDDDKKFKNTTKEEMHFKDGSSVYSWYSHYRNKVKLTVNAFIKAYEDKNMVVPKCLLNKVYLDEDTIEKYEL